MHRRHLPTAVPLFGLAFVLAGCGVAPTAPIVPSPVESRAIGLAAVDCDAAEDIGALIDLLEGDRTLNHGRATALRTRLAQAMRHEAAGRSGHAADAYARLVAQVEEWVADGALDEADVADLLACAEDFLDGPDDPDPDPDPDPEPESPPVIDGIRSSGEWDAATSVAVWTGGTFYYTNDDTHLYIALEMADPDLDAPDGFRIRFDDTQDLIATVGDNEILLGMDRYFDRHRSMFGWGVDDTQEDGTGAGGSSAGVHFFELAFPLNSGDPNDFALAAGDAVGFCVQYLDDGLRVDEATYPRVGAFDNCMQDADQSNYAVLTTNP
jgi:hypothetical protein